MSASLYLSSGSRGTLTYFSCLLRRSSPPNLLANRGIRPRFVCLFFSSGISQIKVDDWLCRREARNFEDGRIVMHLMRTLFLVSFAVEIVGQLLRATEMKMEVFKNGCGDYLVDHNSFSWADNSEIVVCITRWITLVVWSKLAGYYKTSFTRLQSCKHTGIHSSSYRFTTN